MRLQTESRRQSQNSPPMAIDMSRAGTFGSASNKRASFTPLTGTFAASSVTARPNYSHRRVSSSSDTGLNLFITDLTSPNVHSPPFPAELSGAPPVSSRRFSGLFGRNSPPKVSTSPLPSQQLQNNEVLAELESMRKELSSARDQLEETRHELSEAHEAREASETCVNALRAFIAENNVGSHNVLSDSLSTSPLLKLPPLPTEAAASSPSLPETAVPGLKKSTGWGFGKLWKVDTSVKSSSNSGPPSAASISTASPLVGDAPLSRKIGGFFGSRASVSSTTSNEGTKQQQLHLQTNAAASLYSVSDASSVDMEEPLSPTSVGGVFAVKVTDGGSPGSDGVQDHVDAKGIEVNMRGDGLAVLS